ncbi:hypothetical protein C7R92_21640 [Brevibacillus porteri]|uniref:Uncharacterized protein n=1 Tax=Brevibacillus porteri TaxID=2126350 RepID=A0ABX5FLM0_9BACL|nr:hypothetical protein C7R92_21640 [Brevibacillus porteri]
MPSSFVFALESGCSGGEEVHFLYASAYALQGVRLSAPEALGLEMHFFPSDFVPLFEKNTPC